MKYLILLHLISILLLQKATCHCPHMMGIKTEQQSGPSAPGKFPEGDQGWDYDESAAPGSVPKAHFIQSTYVYRSPNELEKGFSKRVVNVLKEIRERLAKTARLTLENENIECSSPTDHFRCQEFSTTGAWNYLIVEDEKNGAVVYTFDRKFNEKNDATIEMALLDALSRHSPHSLIAFASPEAEKEVGYIRAMTNQELGALAKPAKRRLSIEKYGPNELNLVEPALLEVRTGSNLLQNSESSKLAKFENSKEFDESLSTNQFVFVLFWNNNRMVSLHTFNLWLRVAEKSNFGKDVVLAHVACHENADFCHGLNSEDFHTVVAYKDGINIGKTENIGDEEYYSNWIELMRNGALIKIEDEKQLSELKKGNFAGKKRASITIGLFPSEDDTSFKHLKIAAEKLAGKYYIAYFINGNSEPAVSTYRSMEKQKRTDYNGKYDPATLMEFISKSSLPTVLDITQGFTTDSLLRQKRSILIQIGDSEYENAHFSKLAARQDIRKLHIFTKIVNSEKQKEVLKKLGVDKTPVIVVLNKDRVHHISAEQARCPDHLLKLVQDTATSEPNKVLSTKEAHPLRYLQVSKVNSLFGTEDTIVLPDHTLFLDSDPFAKSHSELNIPSTGGTGGCPFMQGGAEPSHDEL